MFPHFVVAPTISWVMLKQPGLPIDSGGLVGEWTALVLRGQPEVVHLQGGPGALGLETIHGKTMGKPWENDGLMGFYGRATLW